MRRFFCLFCPIVYVICFVITVMNFCTVEAVYAGWASEREDPSNRYRDRLEQNYPQDIKRIFIGHDGDRRSYLVQQVSEYDSDVAYPVLIGLHGGGGRGMNFVRSEPMFYEGVKRLGIIGIYPDGLNRQFNDGRTIPDSRTHRENVDDVDFILKVIDQVAQDYNIDQERIYVTGLSNGGHMAYRMACEASDRIAGIAVAAAQMSRNLYEDCQPKRAIPVVFFLGNADPRVPFEGGLIGGRKIKRDIVMSAEQAVKFWVDHNQCSEQPDIDVFEDVNQQDGSQVILKRYKDCKNNANVAYYLIEGGGHTWPGGRQYFPQSIIGRVNADINAVEELWAFFDRLR